MRRPLCLVCLCLVLFSAFRLPFWGSGESAGDKKEGETPAQGERLIVTGQVYRKDNNTIYINVKDIQSNSEAAAGLQQNIPNTKNQIGDGERKGLKRLSCRYPRAGELPLGSIVLLSGRFMPYREAGNPGEFDSRAYYEILGLEGMLQNAELLARSQSFWRIKEALFQLREYWKARLYRIFPQKEASVMTALLLGEKQDLDEGVKELYQKSGIIHILSISGLHITIIGMGFYRILKKLGVPSVWGALAGSIMLLLYGMLTGMGVSACRAIFMFLIRMLGEICGRTYDMLTALALAGAATLLWEPLYLRHGGFLLSYGAVLGIGILHPALLKAFARRQKEKRVRRYGGSGRRVFAEKWQKGKKRLIESISASLSATAATMPVLLWFYYEIPPYSVVLNLLVLPPMQLVMGAGLAAMLIPGLGFLGLADRALLGFYELLCRCFQKLPFSRINPGQPGIWQGILYYSALFGAAALLGKKTSKKAALRRKGQGRRRPTGVLILLSVIAAAASVGVLFVQALPKNQVTFLDVGQGDCIVAETASGKAYLFDCGSSSRSHVGKYVLFPFLKQQGIAYLDAVFVSHPDKDHAGGVEELLTAGKKEGVGVGALVLPQIDSRLLQEAFAGLISLAEKEGIPIRYVGAGDTFGDDMLRAVCLHPPREYFQENPNGYSQCFYIELGKEGELSILLTGDVEGEGEALLLAEMRRLGLEGTDILKAAHHGSRYSTSEEFLAKVKPVLTVISCGEDNSYSHPHPETLQRLEEAGSLVLQTPATGAVSVTCKRGRVLVEQYR